MPQVQGMVYNVVCTIPAKVAAAPAPAPAVITVSPVIQSQVSPQVSPSFVQQQQPTNSPVGTRADQTDTTSTNDVDAIVRLLAQSQAAPPPAPTVVQVPAYMPAPSTTDATDAAQSVTLPTPFGPANVPQATFTRYAPWVALLLIGGAVLYSQKKRARTTTRHTRRMP